MNDNHSNDPPTLFSVLLSWAMVAFFWGPVVMRATGTLVPFLELFQDVVVDGMSEVLERALERPLSAGGGEQPATPTATPTETATPPNQPGVIVAVGLAQILISLIVVAVFLVVIGAGGLFVLVYLFALLTTPIMAISDTRRYLQNR